MSINAPLIEGFTSPTPDKVDGYAAAKAAHQLPEVPDQPPVIKDRTANQRVIRFIVAWFVVFFAFGILDKALKHVGGIPFLIFLIFGIGMLVWLGFFAVSTIDATLAETKEGYTTSKIIFTNGFSLQSRRRSTWNGGRIGWNFNGVWYLKNNGTVITAPDRTVFPPGYYPSPNRSGEFELWTGSAWVGRFKPAV